MSQTGAIQRAGLHKKSTEANQRTQTAPVEFKRPASDRTKTGRKLQEIGDNLRSLSRGLAAVAIEKARLKRTTDSADRPPEKTAA
jgi:hypothetical protein